MSEYYFQQSPNLPGHRIPGKNTTWLAVSDAWCNPHIETVVFIRILLYLFYYINPQRAAAGDGFSKPNRDKSTGVEGAQDIKNAFHVGPPPVVKPILTVKKAPAVSLLELAKPNQSELLKEKPKNSKFGPNSPREGKNQETAPNMYKQSTLCALVEDLIQSKRVFLNTDKKPLLLF